jgi:short-subunit dehydrogenase
MRVDDRTAIITGASSGLGAELARQLAAAGLAVGLTARRAALLDDLAGAIRARGGTAVVAPADAADPDAVRAAIGQLAEALGSVDILIANAGVALRTPDEVFSAEAFERMVRVNLLGAAWAIDAVLPGMLARGRGHLVGISSLAAYRGLPGAAGYCATKAGLTALLEGLRVDLRGRGIAVTTVHPGYVRTAMIEGVDGVQPWVMDVEPAARLILRGIAARRSEVNFPWQTALAMAAVRRLPNVAFDRVATRFSPRRERPQ